MGISSEQLRESVDALAGIEPGFARALERVGYPGPRIREPGFETLFRAIVSQQVSVRAAETIWGRIETAAGGAVTPASLLGVSDEDLRIAGLSRQKISYARSLAELAATGQIDFSALPEDDEEAIETLVRARGIGRWTAEIYLLFAEGRRDVWPAGDLAVQIEIGRILGHEERPSEKMIRELAEPWRPHRGAAAIFAWHHRRVTSDPGFSALPV